MIRNRSAKESRLLSLSPVLVLGRCAGNPANDAGQSAVSTSRPAHVRDGLNPLEGGNGASFATKKAMQLTPTITLRGIEPSLALEAEIRTRIDKLETYYRSIMGCRVLVEFVQRHHETGNRYHVRIYLTVPGEEIVVAHEPSLHSTAQDVDVEEATKADELDPERKHARVAVREAFDIARRRLQDYARRQRGTVKTAARQPRGRVSQFFPIDECGYIEAQDGHEVYFQKSSVLKNAFDRLIVGSMVTFVEELGEKGPQASTVKILHPRRKRQASSPATAAPAIH